MENRESPILKDGQTSSHTASHSCEGHKGAIGQQDPEETYPECRLIMIGKTGTGKSSTGNSLLGAERFKVSPSLVGVTGGCERGRAVRFNRDVQIVDTPGLFDIRTDNETLKKEIVRCIQMSLPGPHAFLLVLQVDRFTPEDKDTIDMFAEVFGEEMFRFAIIIFTRADDLHANGTCIEDFLTTAPPEVEQILHKCGKRVLSINNRASKEEKDMTCQKLLQLVDDLKMNNEGSHYTNDVYLRTIQPVKKMTEDTLNECKRDKILSRRQQKKQVKIYQEEERTKQVELDSLNYCTVSDHDQQALIPKILSELKLLQVKLESLKADMEKRSMNEEELKHKLVRVEQENMELLRSQAGTSWWNWESVQNIVTAVVPLISTIFKVFHKVDG